ncbi:MAG TPA: DEAD/DEAH box helicase, partial [Thermoplasmata archaeon]|nr:DEAD/DEAH box helicase [Thermoplasmata archaeon]
MTLRTAARGANPSKPSGARVRRTQHRLEEFSDGSVDPGAVPRARPEALPGIWRIGSGQVEHPLLNEGVLRALPFQIDFARVGLSEDLLVVLPTGLGKTVIAGLLAAEILRRAPGKVLFLAPTRPLVRQHAESFRRWFKRLTVAQFTGTVKRPVRDGAWEGAEVVFATPELIVNDLAEGRYDLKGVSLLVVDEAHHAVGKYAYVPIAERYRSERPDGGRLLALTASPGGRDERIEEVVRALGVRRIEARSREDPGVAEYVQPVDVEYRWVRLPPELARLQEHLRAGNRSVARR